jgi:hypothetical protein
MTMTIPQVRFLFVQQRPSRQAEEAGATWANGGLADCPLWQALEALGLDPREQRLVGIWRTARTRSWGQDLADEATAHIAIKDAALSGYAVIGMGAVVHAWLDRHDVPHTKLVHPAARGAIRRQARYLRHVAEVLGPLLGREEVAA